MKLAVLFVVLWVGLGDAIFTNPYPKFAKYVDDGDPGEALYLTKYIESGEIELVSERLRRSKYQRMTDNFRELCVE